MTINTQQTHEQLRKISVADAAKRMRCSGRTVLNRIENNDIRGEKPGRDWIICFESVKAYCLKRGITLLPEDLEAPDYKAAESSDTDIPELAPSSAAASESSVITNDVIATSEPSRPNGNHNRRPSAVITVTAAFRLFKEANKILDRVLDASDYAPSDPRFRIRQLQLQAIEHLGGGFYSYGNQKLEQYSEARRAIGAIAALIHIYPSANEEMKKYLNMIEQEVIPAIKSLILYINKKPTGVRRSNRASPEEN